MRLVGIVVVLAACGGGRGGGEGISGGDPPFVETTVEECSSVSVRAMLECEGYTYDADGSQGDTFAGCVAVGMACEAILSGWQVYCDMQPEVGNGWVEECERLAEVANDVAHCAGDVGTAWPEDPETYDCPCPEFTIGMDPDEFNRTNAACIAAH